MTLFISLILHKGVEAFSVGLQISKGNSNKVRRSSCQAAAHVHAVLIQLKAVVATIIIYALMTPIGSGLGTLLQVEPFRTYSYSFIHTVVRCGSYNWL